MVVAELAGELLRCVHAFAGLVLAGHVPAGLAQPSVARAT